MTTTTYHRVMAVRYARSPSPLTADVDGEIVMLDPATSRYFGLADTGARIWELLVAPHDVESLVAALTAEYDVDDDTCRAEVTRFLDTLVAAGLISAEGA